MSHQERRVIKPLALAAISGTLIVSAGVSATAQDVSPSQSKATRKEARLDVVPGATLSVVDNYGSVILRAGAGKQVVVASVLHSGKVEADENVTADKRRATVIAHSISEQKPTPEEARVDLEITVPAGVAVTVATSTAPISADGLSGDLNFSSDTGQITVRNVSRAHVHVRGVSAPVSLNNINLGHVEVTSSGGAVELVDVAGPKVYVGTTSGSISYRGDCSGAGEYSFSTHSGAIDVVLPQTASFDLSARSVTGSVQNDFPLTQKTHTSFVPQAGRSFAGTSNSGSSSVELQSFSGRIRVKKQ
jgi:DUF4097 and DUF4098 domain-containing protein YvlB